MVAGELGLPSIQADFEVAVVMTIIQKEKSMFEKIDKNAVVEKFVIDSYPDRYLTGSLPSGKQAVVGILLPNIWVYTIDNKEEFDEEEQADLTAQLEEWNQNGYALMCWCEEYTITNQGEVIESYPELAVVGTTHHFKSRWS
jgi:hypothetical protein